MGTCRAGPLAPSTLHLHKELQKIRCRISLATTLCVCGRMYAYVCVDVCIHMCVCFMPMYVADGSNWASTQSM